jgi:hypothetical protein
MTKRFAGILIVALVAAWVGILLTAGDSPAQLYRYTDKNGRTVITDNPPPGSRVEVIEEKEPAPSPGSSGDEQKVLPLRGEDARPAPQPRAGAPSAPEDKDKAAEMKRIADEEIQKKQEEARRKLQERQQERQRRLEEADRLEKEAKQPVVPTQENIDRQRKLMEEAERLRQTL